jgi:plastocyanin
MTKIMLGQSGLKRITLILVLLMLFLAMCGCIQPGQSSATTPVPEEMQSIIPTPVITTSSVSANTVVIQNSAFDPATITIRAGDTVRWVNKDQVVHTVTFAKDSGLASSALLSWNQGFSVKIFTPGVYNYTSSVNPGMQGTVVVM